MSKTLRIRKEKERDRYKKLYFLLIILFVINLSILYYLGSLLIPVGIPGIILFIFLAILSILEIFTIFHYADKYSARKFRNRYIKRI